MYVHWKTLSRALKMSLSPRHFRPLQIAMSVPFVAAVGSFSLLVRAGRVVDGILWPDYHNQQVEAPVYIVATMRSGTTFLHRLMSMDEQFTYIRTSHTILSAVFFYRFMDLFSHVDRAIGAPVDRSMRWLENKMFGGWEGIHSVGFNQAEEDEMLWIYAGLSPAYYMLYPYADAFPEGDFVDRQSQDVRDAVGQYYFDCIQRHVYANGGKRLLAKNALKIGRIRTCYDQMPDMRIVHLVRHPYESIASMVSMYATVWRAHSPLMAQDGEPSKALAQLAVDYYRTMHEFAQELPEDQYIRINYEDLIADPEKAVRDVYKRFSIPMSDEFEAQLQQACQQHRSYSSTHKYTLQQYGIDEDWIYEQLQDLFELYGFDPLKRAA